MQPTRRVHRPGEGRDDAGSHGRSLLRAAALGLLLAGLGAGAAPAAQLITGVQLTVEGYAGQPARPNPTTICQGEVLEVEVQASHPRGLPVWTAIDGYPSERRYLQFEGDPGVRHVTVVASADDGANEVRVVTIDLDACQVDALPVIRSKANPYRILTVDFQVLNNPAVDPDVGPWLHWNFGDGTEVSSKEKAVSHFYGDAFQGDAPYETFRVTVSNRPLVNGQPDPTSFYRHYTVSLQDPYFFNKRKGILEPPSRVVEPLELRGETYVGRFWVRNLENESLIYQHGELEALPCDTSRPSTRTQILPSDVLFQRGYDIDPKDPDAVADPAYQAALALLQKLWWLPKDTVAVPPLYDPNNPPSWTRKSLAGPLSRAKASGTTVNLPPIPPPPAKGPTGFVVIPPGHDHYAYLNVPAQAVDAGTCVLAYHLTGESESGLRVYTSLYFESRETPTLATARVDAGEASFLYDLVRRGWVDPAGFTQEDLYELELEGKIRRTESGWEVN